MTSVFWRITFIYLILLVKKVFLEDCTELIIVKDEFLTDDNCLNTIDATAYTEIKPENWLFDENMAGNMSRIEPVLKGLNISREYKDILIPKTWICMRKYGLKQNVSDHCKTIEKFSKCFSNIWDLIIEVCHKNADNSTYLPDPVLKLEIYYEINKIWDKVSRNLRGNSIKFFIHFFGLYPNYVPYFKFIRESDPKSLSENKQLQGHAFVVFEYINALVKNVKEFELFDSLLYRTGFNHAKRNVKIKDFNNLKLALVSFFNTTFGPKVWTNQSIEGKH